MSLSTDREAALDALLTEKEVRDFLVHEAELLDRRELDAWFDLVAEDIVYRMPRKLMTEYVPDSYSDESYFFDERHGSLKARVMRFDSEYAWAERPPSRTRRHVSNLRVVEDDGDEVVAKSNLLVYYSQGDTSDHTVISAERRDTLRRTDEDPGFEIATREIFLDHSVLPVSKVSIFL